MMDGEDGDDFDDDDDGDDGGRGHYNSLTPASLLEGTLM